MKILAVFLVLFCTQLHAQLSQTKPMTTFRFCYQDQPLPPFFTGSGYQVSEQQPGIIVEQLKMLDKQTPTLAVHFARAPWKRCIQGLKRGDYDGVISGFSSQRTTYGIYPMRNGNVDKTLAMSRASYCLYHGKEQRLKWNGNEFVGKSELPVAVPQSYSIIQMLKRHQLSYLEVQSSQQGFKLLQHNRASSVATLCETGDVLLQQQDNQTILRNHPVLERHSGYLLVSHSFHLQHPELTAHMWQTLSQLQHQVTTGLLQQYSYDNP